MHLSWRAWARPAAAARFVPPTLFEIDSIDELGREVFPIWCCCWSALAARQLIAAAINATGYGLTTLAYSRIDDDTIDLVRHGVRMGNIYVNRNIVGAVVGVQPFGGEGLSGTGPKAGGPLYLHCLARRQRRPRKLVADAAPGVLGPGREAKAPRGAALG